MAQISYRANLSAAIYPMTLADGGRTVIIPGPDQNFDRRVDPAGEQKDAGIPQALYLENVLPTANGYQSIGFLGFDPLLMDPYIEIRAVFSISVDAKVFTVAALGDSTFYYTDADGPWTLATTSGTVSLGSGANSYSTATVRGSSYILISEGLGSDLYEATFSGTLTLTNVTASIVGLPALILNITSSYNYLIAITATTAYWSSTTTPLDFTASLVSGAGNQELTNNLATLNYLSPHSAGFYVFTDTNVLFAAYTGNARYPWRFKEITNSGVFSQRRFFYSSANLAVCYGTTDAGTLQVLSPEEASGVAPELSSYLERSTSYDEFDYISNTFSITRAINLFNDRQNSSVFFALNRYLIVSYQDTKQAPVIDGERPLFNAAIIYDTLLQRYGKLKIAHSFVSEVKTTGASLAPKQRLLFINAESGVTTYLNLDIYAGSLGHTGILILGKFQYVRSRKIKLEEVEIEGIQDSALVDPINFSCTLLPSLDGKNFNTPVPLTARDITGGLASYPAHNTAQNHSLILKGAFAVSTVQLKFTPAGDR